MWQIKAQINAESYGCASTHMLHMLSSEDYDMLQINGTMLPGFSYWPWCRVSHTYTQWMPIWLDIWCFWHMVMSQLVRNRKWGQSWGEKDWCTFKISQQVSEVLPWLWNFLSTCQKMTSLRFGEWCCSKVWTWTNTFRYVLCLENKMWTQ